MVNLMEDTDAALAWASHLVPSKMEQHYPA